MYVRSNHTYSFERFVYQKEICKEYIGIQYAPHFLVYSMFLYNFPKILSVSTFVSMSKDDYWRRDSTRLSIKKLLNII